MKKNSVLKLICVLTVATLMLTACGEKNPTNNSGNQESEVNQNQSADNGNQYDTNDESQNNSNGDNATNSDENTISNNGDTTNSNENTTNQVSTDTSKKNASFASEAKNTSLSNPAKIGEAFSTGMYNGSTSKYEKMYIKIEDIITGSAAQKMVEDYNKSAMVILKTEDAIEYRVAKILFDLKDFPTFESGISFLSMDFNIRNLKDEAIEYNNYVFSVLPSAEINRSEERSKQGDVREIYMAYAVPKGYTDSYLIKFGSNFGTEEKGYVVTNK